jgi:Cu(I)/Ag(I) efflux system membrane fusion protein
MKRSDSVWMIVGALLLAGSAGYWIGRRPAPQIAASGGPTASSSSSGSRSVLYWYDPMVPEQHFNKPGLSPMGMQMVPRYAEAADSSGSVQIDAATVQNLGVRIAPVQRRVLKDTWQVPGTVTWNLRRAITVSARTDVVITRLHVRAPYTSLVKGAPLADVFAPAWSSALAEAEALNHVQSPDARALQDAAQQRLAVLGLTPADIRGPRAADGSLTLHAPQAGIVTSLEVREGQRVSAGQPLMTLNDLSSVWVEAAVPQSLTVEVHPGTQVDVRSEALPGKRIVGTVEALLPDLDPATRTQRARIVLPNAGGHLSPGQFVQVDVRSGAETPVLTVPTDALIAAGDHPRVIVSLGRGRFRPVSVTTGRTAAGQTEITSGLRGDEQVVVSAQFLIDSEASLSGALERLAAPTGAPAHNSTSSMPMRGTR